MTSIGPYETEEDTRDAAPFPAIAPAGAGVPAQGDKRTARLFALRDVCADAGVDLGALDLRILDWLAGLDDRTVIVVLGLILRAHAAGQVVGFAAALEQDGG